MQQSVLATFVADIPGRKVLVALLQHAAYLSHVSIAGASPLQLSFKKIVNAAALPK